MPYVDANRRPNVACELCRTPIYRRPNLLLKNKRTFCSTACRNRAYPLDRSNGPPFPKGAANPAWKGGLTYRKRRGNYVSVRYVRCPPELMAMARTDGYVMEHRLVMARLIGRPLVRTEVVHHIDHDPLNNSPSNLELWPCNRSHKLAEHGRYVEGVANRVSLTA